MHLSAHLSVHDKVHVYTITQKIFMKSFANLVRILFWAMFPASLIWVVQLIKHVKYVHNGPMSNYTPCFNEVEWGYTGFTLSVCPSSKKIVLTLASGLHFYMFHVISRQ